MRPAGVFLLSALVLGGIALFTVHVIDSARRDAPPAPEPSGWERVAEADWNALLGPEGREPFPEGPIADHDTLAEVAATVAAAFREGGDAGEVQLGVGDVNELLDLGRTQTPVAILQEILAAGTGDAAPARSLILSLSVPLKRELASYRERIARGLLAGEKRDRDELTRTLQWIALIEALPEPTETTRRNWELVQRVQQERSRR